MPIYEDIATKFFEHFLHIAEAMNNMGDEEIGLWDDEDEFYYDVLHTPGQGTAVAEGPLDGGAHSALCRGSARTEVLGASSPDSCPALELDAGEPAATWRSS